MIHAERKRLWQQHIDDWQASGLSGMAYCQKQSLAYCRFVYWRKKLAEPETEVPEQPVSPGFAKVAAVPGSPLPGARAPNAPAANASHAHPTAPHRVLQNVEGQPSKADVALSHIRKLYAVEKAGNQLSDGERYRLRQEKSLPLLNAFKAWLEKNASKVLKGSLTRKAMDYTLNQWDTLVE